MPIDYKLYPSNWKTEIRPRILKRSGYEFDLSKGGLVSNSRCEKCKAENGKAIFRGTWRSFEVYQTLEGDIFDAKDGEHLATSGDVAPIKGDPNQRAIKVVLTIAHIEHDLSKNEDKDLLALCQQCHLRMDVAHHKQTRQKSKGMKDLFNQNKTQNERRKSFR